MKNAWKRLLALTLAMAMCLSLLSANVWAVEDGAVSVRSSGEQTPEEEEPAGDAFPAEESAPEEETPVEEESASAEGEASLTPQGMTASGTCGANLTWTLDEDGTLTISGTGKMYHWEVQNPPWEDHRSSIKTADIQMGAANIGSSAFSGCSNLSSISIPSSVTSIDDFAFDSCSNLSSISIPDSVVSIGECAFSGCSNLSSISIPSSVTSIGIAAFSGCSSLGSISIPSAVTSIAYETFCGCSSLNSITIPSSVTSIGSEAFLGCSSLSSISIPDSVTSIGIEAFSGCSSLSSISIPRGMTRIGSSALYNCSGLSSISIPDSVTSIDGCAFYGCSNLSSISIPSSVTSIGDSAFFGCSSLSSVSMPGGVISISRSAFRNCVSLKSVTIPASVTEIASGDGGNAPFMGCKNLSEIIVEAGNRVYCSKDGALYSKDMTQLKYCPEGKASIEIPETVTSISNDAFYSAEGTGSSAAVRQTALQKIVFLGNAPAMGDRLFVSVKASAWYPGNDSTWTSDKLRNYGGSITWISSNRITDCVITVDAEGCTYDGKPKTPAVSVTNKSTLLTEGQDYTISCSDNINAGKASVTVTGKGNYDGSVTKEFYIAQAAPVMRYSDGAISKRITDAAFTNPLTKTTDGAVTFSSDNTGVAEVNSSTGEVTIKGAGKTTVTATAAAGRNYKAGSASYTLTVSAGETYTVTYDANGGTGTPSRQTKDEDVPLTLSTVTPAKNHLISYNAAGGKVTPASKSVACTFRNWNTAQNGRGTAYSAGGSYSANANVTLYAQWDNPQAGELAEPVRNGYDFLGWFTAPTGGERVLNTTTLTGSMTIYAHWYDSYNLGDETYSFDNFGDSDSPYGHCFGMSATSAGYHNNLLDIRSIGGDKNTSLYSFDRTTEVKKPICYYQSRQGLSSRQSIVAGGSTYLHGSSNISSDWNEVVNYVKNHAFDNTGILQIGVRKNNEGGHAINFLRYEKVNGQDRIYAYDNNFPDTETYFYRSGSGSVQQAPVQSFSGEIDCIALRDIRTYFSIVGGFDATHALYVVKDAATVEGYSYSLMEGAMNGQEYVMYEIPANQKYVTIIPHRDNADFIYMDTEYSFGKITENTRARLSFSTMNDYGGGSDAKIEIYENESPKPTVQLSQSVFTYNAQVQKPTVTVKVNGKLLKEGQDYTIEYPSGMVMPGTYSIKVILKGEYVGSCIANYTIEAANSSKIPNTIQVKKSFTKTASNQKDVSFNLEASANGAPLSYESSSKNVSVENGMVTIQKGFAGKAIITINAVETDQYLSAQKQVTVKVNPSVTQISSLTWAAKKKTAAVSWKKNTTGKGYELQYSTDKKFKKNRKKSKFGKNSTVKTTIKGLRQGTYYFRIRTVNGKLSSGWSKVKTLKITK